MHTSVHAKYYVEREDNSKLNRIEVVVGFDSQLEQLIKASQELEQDFGVKTYNMQLTHYNDTGLNDKLFGLAFVVGEREIPEGFNPLRENHHLIKKYNPGATAVISSPAKYYVEREDYPQFNRIEVVVGSDAQLEKLTQVSQELVQEFGVNTKDMWLTHYANETLHENLYGVAFVIGQRDLPQGFTRLPENHRFIRKYN